MLDTEKMLASNNIIMPISLKMHALLSAKPAVERLATMRFPITTSYRLAKRLKIISEEFGLYEKKHNELVTRFGTPIEGQPGQIEIRPNILDPETRKSTPNPKWSEYLSENQKLLDMDVTLENFDPIRVSELIVYAQSTTCHKCNAVTTDNISPTLTLGETLMLGDLLVEDTELPPVTPLKSV